MKTVDELDALHAAATAGEWYRDERGYVPGVAVALAFDGSPTLDGRSIMRGNTAWPAECRANEDFAMRAKNAWPEFSARLRAAEAEAERLRGALRSVRDDYDCDGVGTGGLECRHCLARAALGEP